MCQSTATLVVCVITTVCAICRCVDNNRWYECRRDETRWRSRTRLHDQTWRHESSSCSGHCPVGLHLKPKKPPGRCTYVALIQTLHAAPAVHCALPVHCFCVASALLSQAQRRCITYEQYLQIHSPLRTANACVAFTTHSRRAESISSLALQKEITSMLCAQPTQLRKSFAVAAHMRRNTSAGSSGESAC